MYRKEDTMAKKEKVERTEQETTIEKSMNIANKKLTTTFIQDVSIDKISLLEPHKVVREDSLDGLLASISHIGVITPLIVIPYKDLEDEEDEEDEESATFPYPTQPEKEWGNDLSDELDNDLSDDLDNDLNNELANDSNEELDNDSSDELDNEDEDEVEDVEETSDDNKIQDSKEVYGKAQEYILVDGLRRLYTAKRLGMNTVPVIVIDTQNYEGLFEDVFLLGRIISNKARLTNRGLWEAIQILEEKGIDDLIAVDSLLGLEGGDTVKIKDLMTCEFPELALEYQNGGKLAALYRQLDKARKESIKRETSDIDGEVVSSTPKDKKQAKKELGFEVEDSTTLDTFPSPTYVGNVPSFNSGEIRILEVYVIDKGAAEVTRKLLGIVKLGTTEIMVDKLDYNVETQKLIFVENKITMSKWDEYFEKGLIMSQAQVQEEQVEELDEDSTDTSPLVEFDSFDLENEDEIEDEVVSDVEELELEVDNSIEENEEEQEEQDESKETLLKDKKERNSIFKPFDASLLDDLNGDEDEEDEEDEDSLGSLLGGSLSKDSWR